MEAFLKIQSIGQLTTWGYLGKYKEHYPLNCLENPTHRNHSAAFIECGQLGVVFPPHPLLFFSGFFSGYFEMNSLFVVSSTFGKGIFDVNVMDQEFGGRDVRFVYRLYVIIFVRCDCSCSRIWNFLREI